MGSAVRVKSTGRRGQPVILSLVTHCPAQLSPLIKPPFVPASTNPDGSFNFYDENLFGIGGKLYANFDAATFNPATSEFTTVISPALYQIDANTGQAAKVASTDLGLITIINLNGTIYGFSGATNQVVTLDVTNGITSLVSDIDPSAGLIAGAAPVVPEPASIILTGIGIAGLAIYRRRRYRRTSELIITPQ